SSGANSLVVANQHTTLPYAITYTGTAAADSLEAPVPPGEAAVWSVTGLGSGGLLGISSSTGTADAHGVNFTGVETLMIDRAGSRAAVRDHELDPARQGHGAHRHWRPVRSARANLVVRNRRRRVRHSGQRRVGLDRERPRVDDRLRRPDDGHDGDGHSDLHE